MNTNALAIITANPILSVVIALAALTCIALLSRLVAGAISDASAARRARALREARRENRPVDPIFFTHR